MAAAVSTVWNASMVDSKIDRGVGTDGCSVFVTSLIGEYNISCYI